MANIDPKTLDLKEKLVSMNRVAKTVKGGRTMRMAALVVVGDGNGHVGVGLGKAVEFQEAIRKATEDAKKNIVCISTCGTTIPHEAIGKFGKSSVLLMPAPEGTGVIAGGSVRAVIEMAGIRDIRTKCHGSNNPANSVKAALEGLKSLKNGRILPVCAARPAKKLWVKEAAAMLKITLQKSLIGRKQDQIATAKALGLTKIRSSVIKQDNAAMRGMIFKIKHLVSVEEVD